MFTIFFDELQRIWRYRWLVIGVAAVLLLGAILFYLARNLRKDEAV
jgi:uncharacterized protein involved in exopolysaccharide biosynthesis